MRIALLNFAPDRCPDCGARTDLVDRIRSGRSDYLGGASQQCQHCHCLFQFVTHTPLVKAAEESGGDLARHLR